MTPRTLLLPVLMSSLLIFSHSVRAEGLLTWIPEPEPKYVELSRVDPSFSSDIEATYPAEALGVASFAIPRPVTVSRKTSGTITKAPPADSAFIRKIPEGRYLYKFRWNGIPSAASEIVVSMKEIDGQSCYVVKGTARTSHFAAILWRFRARFVAVVDALTGRARRIRVAERQNARLKETETVFHYEAAEARYTRWKKGRVKEKTISLDGDIIDPVSLGLILCYEPLKVGDSASFTVLSGDDVYVLEYEVTGRERILAAGSEFDALRVEPRFHKIQKKRKPPKVRQMTIWLSDAQPRIPLRMRSKTFIGHVTGKLVRMMPTRVLKKVEIDMT